MNVEQIAPDFAVVKHMWKYYSPQADMERFQAAIKKGKTQIMLAVTAPEGEQKFAWQALEKAGFTKLLSGLRSLGHTGHKYLYLWGKREKCLPRIKRTTHDFGFASCGASGQGYRKKDEVTKDAWTKCITVHRVLTASKVQIPKDFALIAKTRFASYYVENAQEIFATL